MIFYIGAAVLAFLTLFWLWKVLVPRKVYHTSVRNKYDSKDRYIGFETVKDKKPSYYWFFDAWWTAVLGTVGILLLGAAAVALWGVVLAGIQNLAQHSPTLASQNDKKLVALTVGDDLSQGRYFLATGYESGYPTFRYLYEGDDSGVRLGYIYATNGAVYEDEQDEPFRTEYLWHKYDPWISPFASWYGESYAFHVPTGSVTSDYTVEVGQ